MFCSSLLKYHIMKDSFSAACTLYSFWAADIFNVSNNYWSDVSLKQVSEKPGPDTRDSADNV